MYSEEKGVWQNIDEHFTIKPSILRTSHTSGVERYPSIPTHTMNHEQVGGLNLSRDTLKKRKVRARTKMRGSMEKLAGAVNRTCRLEHPFYTSGQEIEVKHSMSLVNIRCQVVGNDR